MHFDLKILSKDIISVKSNVIDICIYICRLLIMFLKVIVSKSKKITRYKTNLMTPYILNNVHEYLQQYILITSETKNDHLIICLC